MTQITNYGNLQTVVADYLNREDLTSQIPQFIQFAEIKIYRNVRCPANEKYVTYDTATYDNTVSLQIPVDYIEAKTVQYDDRGLERVSDQYFVRRDPQRAAGPPLRFARIGGFLFFDPPADENADVDLYYYFSETISDANPVTAILNIAPELYLYGSLLEAVPFLKNDERIPVWQSLYQEALGYVNGQAWEAEYAGSTVAVATVYPDDSRTGTSRALYE